MNINPNFRLFNQALDFNLGPIEDENLLKEIRNSFRKTLFISDAFLLKEGPGKIVGVYADGDGAGTTLSEQEGNWYINLGFGEMNLEQIDEMLSFFGPFKETLNKLKAKLFMNLVYVLENKNQNNDDENGYLKEAVLAVPQSMIDDGIRRIFKLQLQQSSTAYRFTSLHEENVSINKVVTLLHNERTNAEKLFIPSFYCWLSSLKHPEPINDPGVQKVKIPVINCNNGSSH
jgi:hypothetical protein